MLDDDINGRRIYEIPKTKAKSDKANDFLLEEAVWHSKRYDRLG